MTFLLALIQAAAVKAGFYDNTVVCEFFIPEGHHMYYQNPEFPTKITLEGGKVLEDVAWSAPEL